MSFDVDIGYASRRGPRELNEDFGGVRRGAGEDAARGLVAAIADGVSGGGLGLEAAQTTVMGLLADYFAAPATWETSVVLDRLIGAQNAWLADHNRRRSGAAALTTLTALALRGQTWTLAHVGDTRAALLRAGPDGDEWSQLSQDHAFDHPDQRGRLTRAVGLDDVVRLDIAQGDIRSGDVFVLTSDGVHGRLRAARIAEIVRAGDPQAAA
ncbi:MAG: protein phosphatase 2C domain-containing protein, partial [Burkholderiales bacterium]|nr:protein phosphatase 2C domain-containing protein [Burkholderiales bacterium]